jgi:ABC-2 type transport system permease protein
MNTMPKMMPDALPDTAPARAPTPLHRTMLWLVRREIWEHKGMLVWVTLAISALLIAFVLVAAVMGHSGTIHFDGGEIGGKDVVVQLGERQKQAAAEFASSTYPLGGIVLYASMAFMVFFYSLGALYDERRDRSILFWKSLPVSDTATVLSKAIFALLGIPLLVIVVELATSLILLAIMLVLAASKGVNLIGLVLTHPQFWLGLVKIPSVLPVYVLWALPSVGWLLLVSAWARSKVFLWAIGVPALATAVLFWAEKGLGLALNAGWLVEKFVSRLLVGVAPGTWLMANDMNERMREMGGEARVRGPAAISDMLYESSWAAVATPETIVGMLAGACMIAAAIWLRRRREEG